MKRNTGFCAPATGKMAGFIIGLGALAAVLTPAQAGIYQMTDLVTDDPAFLASLGYPAAAHTDPNLLNPWGVSFSSTSPYWVSDNNAGVTTLYTAAGVQVSPPSPVTIFTPSGQAPGTGTPTGTVFNGNTSNFIVTNGAQSGSSTFIFATEDGTISGWPSSIRPTTTFKAVDNSTNGAVYKGLATATNANGTFLYAANFNSGQVEMYNSSFGLVKSFTDPSPPPIPAGSVGWAPFNVYNDGNGHLLVAFAAQNSAKHDDVAGPGNGFVDEFDTNGNFIERIATGGVLDSPWGLDLAPANFGPFSNDLLVGNFGNGLINVFDPTTGAPLGDLTDANGNAIVIGDLWALVNGNNGAGSDPNAVYFTAGLMDEAHGLFGDIAFVPEPGSLVLLAAGLTSLAWLRRRRTA